MSVSTRKWYLAATVWPGESAVLSDGRPAFKQWLEVLKSTSTSTSSTPWTDMRWVFLSILETRNDAFQIEMNLANPVLVGYARALLNHLKKMANPRLEGGLGVSVETISVLTHIYRGSGDGIKSEIADLIADLLRTPESITNDWGDVQVVSKFRWILLKFLDNNHLRLVKNWARMADHYPNDPVRARAKAWIIERKM